MLKKRKKILSVPEKVVFLQSRLRGKKRGWGRVEIIESKQKPKAACHGPFAAGRMVVAGNEKGKKRQFRDSYNEEFDPGSG